MRFTHDTKQVIHVLADGAKVAPGAKLTLFEGTEDACHAERDRLSLADPRGLLGTVIPLPDKGVLAADYFRTLDPAIQQKFGVLFTGLSALKNDRDKVEAIQAITPADAAETTAKAQLIAILQ